MPNKSYPTGTIGRCPACSADLLYVKKHKKYRKPRAEVVCSKCQWIGIEYLATVLSYHFGGEGPNPEIEWGFVKR